METVNGMSSSINATGTSATNTVSTTINTTAAPASFPVEDVPALAPRAFQAAYRRYIAQAQAVPAADVVPFHGDILAILRNVRIGLASVMPRLAQVRSELPSIDLQLVTELPELVEALFHATRLVIEPVSPRAIAERFERVSPLRKEMLRVAMAFARRGMMPAERVEHIRRGKGRIDVATDAVDLAALYVDYQGPIAGKHPFTKEEIDTMADDGAWLVRALTKGGLRRLEVAQNGLSARDVRDRLYTLVSGGHRTLRRIGAYLWENQVGNHVPKMGTRKTSPRPSAIGGATAPTTAPAAVSSTPTA